MTHRMRTICLATLLLSLLLIASAAQAATFGNLDVSIIDPTTVEVSWAGDASHEYRAYFGVQGAEWHYWYTTDGLTVTVSDLAPNTYYEVVIEDQSTNDTLTQTFRTDKSEAYREYNYRWNQCYIYIIRAGEAPNLYDRPRERITSISQSSARQHMKDGEIAVSIQFSWKRSNYDKEIYQTVVLRTPSGNVFTDQFERTIDGSWDGAYLLTTLDGLFDDMTEWKSNWEKGTYTVELYNDGWFAGRSSFTLK